MKLLIKNIKQLVGIEYSSELKKYKKGLEMRNLLCIEDAYLAVEDGIIVDFGKMEEWPGISDWSDLEIIDAEGKFVLPGFIDSHTHLIYAGSREKEFEDRINGLSYQQIFERGGGILNSAKKLAESSEEELFNEALKRLNELISLGTVAVEIKSGYGLSLDSELKMLRVIQKIKEISPIPVKSTFLGAHAVPSGMDKQHYIKLIIDEMIPLVASEKLADFIDVFCEQGYFTQEEAETILNAGKKFGLIPKVHANQLSINGGVQAGVNTGAISVDHLEYVGEEEIACLLKSSTMPTLLPGAAFFLNLPDPPARKMIDAGLPVSLASDYNPGSSPIGNMHFMISYACIRFKMTPNEALNAATLNAAYAIGVENQLGSIAIGKKASFIITKEMPSLAYFPYSFGSNLIDTVIVNGKIIN
jgi:imidazolonepropionase